MNMHLFIQRPVFNYRKQTNLKQNDCYSSKPRSNRLNFFVFGASIIGYDTDPDEHGAFVPPTISLKLYHTDPDEHVFVPPTNSLQLYHTDPNEHAFVPPTISLQLYDTDPDEHAFVHPMISLQLYDTDLDEVV